MNVKLSNYNVLQNESMSNVNTLFAGKNKQLQQNHIAQEHCYYELMYYYNVLMLVMTNITFVCIGTSDDFMHAKIFFD